MQEISKRVMVLNIILSQLILLIIALGLRFIWGDNFKFNLFKFGFTFQALFVALCGSLLLLLIQYIFIKYVSKESLFDEINKILLNIFSLPELFIIFLCGAFAEELLFRGIIQPIAGLLLTSVIFTLIHFRYLKKPHILGEVFILGIILGFTYYLTSFLWVPILCHLLVNFMTAFLVKKGYLDYA